LAPPFVVFWGVIDRRMDTEFVRRVAETIAGTVVLIGPQEDPDPALFSIPRVVVRPPVPFAQLPVVAAAADVLVMPYADLPVTRAIQPLKLKEYLATGKPTVVRDLPATREWADACDVVATADDFAARVGERIKGGVPASQQVARRRLVAESWAGKAALFERWVTGEA
jgi:glycosyltransferase involved in cell wall biosynthesis